MFNNNFKFLLNYHREFQSLGEITFDHLCRDDFKNKTSHLDGRTRICEFVNKKVAHIDNSQIFCGQSMEQILNKNSGNLSLPSSTGAVIPVQQQYTQYNNISVYDTNKPLSVYQLNWNQLFNLFNKNVKNMRSQHIPFNKFVKEFKKRSFYNRKEHSWTFVHENLMLKFVYPPYSQFFDKVDSPNLDIEYIGKFKYDKRQFPRLTQGWNIAVTYASEALTGLTSAVSFYYIYRIMRYAGLIFRHSRNVPQEMFNYLKAMSVDILVISCLLIRWLSGAMTFNDAMATIAGWAVSKTYLLPLITKIGEHFNGRTGMSPHSIDRHTQAGNDTSLLHCVVSVVGLFLTGMIPSAEVAKSIISNIKSLGSTILVAKTFDKIVVELVNILPDIIVNFLCSSFPQVMLYVKLNTDAEFKTLVVDMNSMIALDSSEILYNSHNLNVFLVTYDKLKLYLSKQEYIDQGIGQLFSKHIDFFDTTYSLIARQGLLPGKRKMPYVIWLSGPPGIGKSTLAKSLALAILRDSIMPLHKKSSVDNHISDDELNKMIYSYSTGNRFFDGYNNQPIFILNDYLQFSNDDEEKWLIKLVDTLDLQLEVASVDNVSTGVKGEVRFTSSVIIITSNTTHLNVSDSITNTEAFNRRRNIVVDLNYLKDKDNKINFDKFDYSWCKFELLDPLKMPRISQVSFSNVDSLYKRILEDFHAHSKIATKMKFVLNSSRSTWVEKPLAQLVAHQSVLRNLWDDIMERSYKMAYKILNTKIIGTNDHYITIDHLLKVFMVGTVSYGIWKSCSSFFVTNIAQSLSGDVSTRRAAVERRPLARHTMGMSKNLQDVSKLIINNMCEITTFITHKQNLVKQTMFGLFLGGSILVTPKHLWVRGSSSVANGDKIVISFKGLTIPFQCDLDNLYLDPHRDMAAYNVLFNIPNVKAIDHFLMPKDFNPKVKGEEVVLITKSGDLSMLHPATAVIQSSPYEDEFGAYFEGNEIWSYNLKTTQGDCGSVLVGINGKPTIFGIHVAGDMYSGNAEILDITFLDQVKEHFLTRKTQGFCTDAIYDDDEWFDAESDLDEGFIFLGKSRLAPWQNTETEIRKGPLYEVLQPHISEPAVLTPSDSRLENVCSPMINSVSKYGTPIPPFNKQLMDKAYRIVGSMYEVMGHEKFFVNNHNDAINSVNCKYLEKLDISTSAGYPWNVTRKKKSDLINNKDGTLVIGEELQKKLNTCENLLMKQTMFPYTLTTTLKDERVSLNKVRIGKTRTFMNFPVEYTILMRKYFDCFINYETQYAREIGTTIGVNIYSSQWQSIYNELRQFEYHTDGDFKAFDGSIRPEFFRYYSRLVNKFYKDNHGAKRDMLVHGCCFAPIFVLNKVYLKNQGNPSGSRITSSFNSFVNRMYVIMSMLNVLPEQFHTIDFFKTNMKMYAHGDDHLIGFSKSIFDFWDALVLKKFMGNHNIEYTSSKKDQPLMAFNKLENCFYLKSHFVFDIKTNEIRCGLDKEVIQEMVSWQRDDTRESTEMILNTCLRYAWFWGEDYFNEIREKLLNALVNRNMYIPLVDYLDLENEYRFNEQLSFEYI